MSAIKRSKTLFSDDDVTLGDTFSDEDFDFSLDELEFTPTAEKIKEVHSRAHLPCSPIEVDPKADEIQALQEEIRSLKSQLQMCHSCKYNLFYCTCMSGKFQGTMLM